MSMKSGFLKGLIYKDTGPTGDTKTPVSATSPSSAPVQILNAPTVTVQGVADNKFIELLEKVIEQKIVFLPSRNDHTDHTHDV